MANRIYFINNSTDTAVAYDFDGNAQSSDNISLGTGTWRGGVASDDRIYFLNATLTAVAYDFDGNAQTTDNISLPIGTWVGGVATDDRIYFVDANIWRAIAYDFDGNRQASDDISSLPANPAGAVATDDRIYFVSGAHTDAVAYDFDGNRQTSDDINLGTASWRGGGRSNNRIYFINNGTNTAVAYDFDGNAQSSDNISLGAATWEGGITTFQPQATATITTTDTDWRVGEQNNLTITFSAAVTGLTASDFTVTGGTRGNLSGSGTTYTLQVTATSAGTLTVSLPENAVTEGNVAVSQDFTINARVSATITPTDPTIQTNASTTITVNWSESVTGFIASELIASAGALSNFSHSGDTTTATLTAPSSGNGTITISIPANAVSAGGVGNLAVSGSVMYEEPIMLAWVVPTADVGREFSVTLTSNYPLTGVALSDFRLRREDATFYNLTNQNATLTNISGTNNWRIDIDLDGTHDHDFLIRLVRRSVTANGDAAPANNLNSANFHVDTSITDTSVTITTTPVMIYEAQAFTATIIFSKVVTGFTTDDISVTGASKGTSFTGSGTTYTQQFTADAGAGTIEVRILENSIDGGNPTFQESFTRLALPTFTIQDITTTIYEQSTFDITLTASAAVTDFVASDLTVTGATVNALTGSGTDYTLNVTADSGAGNIVITIPANVVMPGNHLATRTYTRTALPTLTISTTDTAIMQGESVAFDVVFSQSVTGVAQSDFTVIGGTITALTGSGTDYVLTITVGTATAVQISVAMNAVIPGNVAYARSFAVEIPLPVSPSAVQTVGNVWFGDVPFHRVGIPMQAIDGELHVIASHGNRDGLPQHAADASLPTNYQRVKYGDKLRFALNALPTGLVQEKLVGISSQTDTVFSVVNNRITVKGRDPIYADLNGTLTPTANALGYDGETMALPSTGYVFIDKEIISYSGKTTTQLTGLVRGLGGSTASAHTDNAEILYLDNTINADSYLGIQIRLDTNRFFNVVQDSNLLYRAEDTALIDQHGEKVFTVDFGLDRHQTGWAVYMYEKYLEYLKEVRQFVTITLKPSFYIRLGDVISFFYDDNLLYPIRVTSINYTRASTEIVGRSI